MAHNDVEVEIKVKLTKKKFESVEKLVKKTSKFVKSSHHIDDYYLPKQKSFLKPKYPYEWLTIRLRDGKTLLNYKHWYPEGIKDTTHCDEYETEVLDSKSLHKLLTALNFEKFITVEKQRRVYIYKNNIEIAFDGVKGLGNFLEVESLKNFGGVKKTHQKLVEHLNHLGIKDTSTIPGGYASEIMRKRGLLKN